MSNYVVITTFIAFFSLIVSIISIVFTRDASKKQQEHNINSVKPICNIRTYDYEYDISVHIFNYGNGPLIINKLECFLRNENPSDVLIKLMPPEINEWTDFAEDITGWSIPVNGKFTLIQTKTNDKNIKKQIRDVLKHITIKVQFKDIYGNIDNEKRKLDFYGRH